MTSINSMIKRNAGLSVKEAGDWAFQFSQDIYQRTNSGKDCHLLSDKQIDSIGRIFKQHFGDAD